MIFDWLRGCEAVRKRTKTVLSLTLKPGWLWSSWVHKSHFSCAWCVKTFRHSGGGALFPEFSQKGSMHFTKHAALHLFHVLVSGQSSSFFPDPFERRRKTSGCSVSSLWCFWLKLQLQARPRLRVQRRPAEITFQEWNVQREVQIKGRMRVNLGGSAFPRSDG